MRISDWSSDVCSSDLFKLLHGGVAMISLALASMLVLAQADAGLPQARRAYGDCLNRAVRSHPDSKTRTAAFDKGLATACAAKEAAYRNAIMASAKAAGASATARAEEHTSELQSLMRISSDVTCSTK